MSKFDFSGIDPSIIDPDRLNLGTKEQDCMIIANTFERAAHSIPTEAAIFAPMTRILQNNKQVVKSISSTIKPYLLVPPADKTGEQAQQFSSGYSQQPVQSTDSIQQGLNFGNVQTSTYDKSFGDKLLKLGRDCIPCGLRMVSFMELNPHIDLLNVFEDFVKKQIEMLMNSINLLTNIDIYADFCSFLNLMSFMCIPDLQRIIALLMALFILEIPKLDGLFGMIKGLIVPLFSPILLGLTALFDQFIMMVVNPLDCVNNAIKAQIKKLNVETPYFSVKVKAVNPLEDIVSGLIMLDKQLHEAIQVVREKMTFYIEQVKAMLSDMGGTDAAYISLQFKLLNIIRMKSFVIALISALQRGSLACAKDGKAASTAEIDNFFNNFLNPQSSFNLWTDEQGEIHIDEKVLDFDEVIKPLSEFGNMLQFEGEAQIDYNVASQQLQQASQTLNQSIKRIIPCSFKTSNTDIDQVNIWMSQLDKS